jgi:hypothetical protein
LTDLEAFIAMLERAGIGCLVEERDGATRVYCGPAEGKFGLLHDYGAALVFRDGALVATGALI